MTMEWIRVGVREEYIRSLFKEDTWSILFEAFPEVKEVSFFGDNGSWKPAVKGVSKEDRIEIYVHLYDKPLQTLTEKQSMKLIKKLYRFLDKKTTESLFIELKIETRYIGRLSGLVYRKELPEPIHYWYHMGIQGFKERVVFDCWTD